MERAISTDGTAIAYDRLGEGPPVILIGAALCDRTATRPLAEAVARHHTVFNYDRRGRGDSGDTQPYAVQREIEDLAALIDRAGGTASIYGHSSGAALALHAAAHGLPITKLILNEPPFSPSKRARTITTGRPPRTGPPPSRQQRSRLCWPKAAAPRRSNPSWRRRACRSRPSSR